MKIFLKDLKNKEKKVIKNYLETHEHLLRIDNGSCRLDREYWDNKNTIDDLQYDFKELVLSLFDKNETSNIELELYEK